MTFFIFTVFAIQFALNVYIFSTQPSWFAFVQLAPHIIIFVINLMIWLLRKRFMRLIPCFYIMCLIFQSVVFVFGTPLAQAIMTPEMQQLNKEAVLRSQMANCFRTTSFLILCGTPSMFYLIVYLLIYVLAIVSLSLMKGDMNDPIFIDSLKLQPGNVIAMILIFASLQGRELRRFNDKH